ncbi:MULTISPECIES: F0F1 ATP synthase subunit delta [unclassified Virgibacillus]|uniref:F0F1 ATP synthase subunit delta n=1 Tax=unclassified Virgibacillus TaxID=2620237 RepID=UPI0024DECCC5|nr:F0F1 ATP synthase subunit delta [Virgibacillus sp. LDC-1]
MSEAIVAKRYADALFQLGNDKAALDQLMEEFRVVKQVFQEDKQLRGFLAHPRITLSQKTTFIDEVFKDCSKDVLNTLKLLAERHRVALVPSIIENFINLVNSARGVAEATVHSVRKLSDAELKDLETTVAKRFNKSVVHLENKVDPSLLGGIKIRIGNTIIDGTISGKLKRIERNIITSNN